MALTPAQRETQAKRLEAVAEWFTDCKTLTLEQLPKGLITDLQAGAAALRQPSVEELVARVQAMAKRQAAMCAECGLSVDYDAFTTSLSKLLQSGQAQP